MNCEHCSVSIPENSNFCNVCGKQQASAIRNLYKNPKGTWLVTTEADEEGRRRVDLGIHTGYVDEIACALAPKCFYTLQFKAVAPTPLSPRNDVRSVHVSFAAESGTWNMSPTERAMEVRSRFRYASRPVAIQEGRYYASFLIVYPDNNSK